MVPIKDEVMKLENENWLKWFNDSTTPNRIAWLKHDEDKIVMIDDTFNESVKVLSFE